MCVCVALNSSECTVPLCALQRGWILPSSVRPVPQFLLCQQHLEPGLHRFSIQPHRFEAQMLAFLQLCRRMGSCGRRAAGTEDRTRRCRRHAAAALWGCTRLRLVTLLAGIRPLLKLQGANRFRADRRMRPSRAPGPVLRRRRSCPLPTSQPRQRLGCGQASSRPRGARTFGIP